MSGSVKLLFVYNADSGLFNALADIGHKLFSPATYPCVLCAITHGVLTERAEWRSFIESLDVVCEFLHRDQFSERFPDVAAALPAIFRLDGDTIRLCADAPTLDACQGLADLQTLIRLECLGDSDQGQIEGVRTPER